MYNPGNDFTEIKVIDTNPFEKKRCVQIYNKKNNDARLTQEVNLPPDNYFEFSCRIRTEDVTNEGIGAVLSVQDYITTSVPLYGTINEWRKRSVYIKTGGTAKRVTLCLCLGGYGAGSTGKAYFDAAELVVTNAIPDNVPIVDVGDIPTIEKQLVKQNETYKQAQIIKNQKQKQEQATAHIMTAIAAVMIIAGLIALLTVIIIKKRRVIMPILKIMKIDVIKDFILTHKFFLMLFFLVLIFTVVMTLPKVLDNQPLSADVYRDVAYAQNVLNGNSIFSDATIKGEFIWYPPLNALMMAGISKITGIRILDLYNYSQLFINAFIPILFFLFLTTLFDKKYAFLSALLIPLMPWLSTHVFQGPMPSVHSFAFILLSLFIYVSHEKAGMTIKRAVINGALMGMCLLMHTLSGFILYGGIGIYVLLSIFVFKQKYRLIPFLILALLPLLLWSPYAIPNLLRPKLNPVPIVFFSNVLLDRNWYLYIPTRSLCVLFWLFTITGFAVLAKHIKQKGILILYCMVGITLIGQVFGYVQYWASTTHGVPEFLKNLPRLITHEFQWYFQLFILPFTGYGFLTLLYKCINKKYKWTYIIIIFLFCIQSYVTFIKNNEAWAKGKFSFTPPDYVEWVTKNTDKNAVFLVSNENQCFFDFQPYTARKIIYHKSEYMNFNIDVEKRKNDNKRMLLTAHINEFRSLATLYKLDYILLNFDDVTPDRLKFFKENFDTMYEEEFLIILKV
ncbi:MAG: hypothetical protein JXJ04_00215 [Spirochaetales bacterium]|nr:hypothetical protein [Spirochaetales bacterium]